MKRLIITPKSKGNTYDVASYMAQKSGAQLLVTGSGQMEDLTRYDELVLCSGVYAGKAHAGLIKWLNQLSKDQLSTQARFRILVTWFGRSNSNETAEKEIMKALAQKGLTYDKNCKDCLGGKGFIRSGHPNQADLDQVMTWLTGSETAGK